MKAAALILGAVLVLAAPLRAEPVPCDSCAGYPAGAFMTSGGPELGGDVWFLSCQGGVWEELDAGSGDPCSPACGDPALGTVCADGAVYGGITVGGARMYVASADQAGMLQWKTTSSLTTGTDSSSDGLTNTDAMAAAGIALHTAAQSCRTRGAEWYLPAIDELATLYANRTQLAAANLPTTGTHWSSSQRNASTGWMFQFGTGSTTSNEKTTTRAVRCVRR